MGGYSGEIVDNGDRNMDNKSRTPKFIILAIVCFLISTGVSFYYPYMRDSGILISAAIVVATGIYSLFRSAQYGWGMKLGLGIAVSGFLTIICSMMAPPLFFVIFLLIATILSVIILVKKRKIDFVCIIVLVGSAVIFIEVGVLHSVTMSIPGLVFIFAASVVALLELFNPDMIKSRKFVLGVLLVLALFFAGSTLFFMNYGIVIEPAGPRLVPANWTP